MIRRGFRSSSVGQPTEKPHPKLCALLQMGDGINEPQGLGRYAPSDMPGTVVEGAFPGSYARRYSNPGGYVQLGYGTYRTYPWTAMFFIRPCVSTFEAFLFLSSNPTGRSSIRVSNTAIRFVRYDGSITYANASVTLNANTWYHVAISCGSSAGQWKIWLNGTQLSLTTNYSYDYLGQSGSGEYVYLVYLADSYTVDIDHVKVYVDQLSNSEVVEEMNKKVW
ncbi:MAG: LamG-like jellyroll fold domain-containing protein [Candidatus Methanomethylicaceae archaeon]